MFKNYTKQQKINYFKGRVNDLSLTAEDRKYAELRLNQLLYKEYCVYNTHANNLGIDQNQNRYFLTLRKKRYNQKNAGDHLVTTISTMFDDTSDTTIKPNVIDHINNDLRMELDVNVSPSQRRRTIMLDTEYVKVDNNCIFSHEINVSGIEEIEDFIYNKNSFKKRNKIRKKNREKRDE